MHSPNWTVDPDTGIPNSSEAFKIRQNAIESILRKQVPGIKSGDLSSVSWMILANLAKEFKMRPE